MEEEIDLKPYILALLRSWYVIILAGVLVGLGSGLVRFLTSSPQYEARQSLWIVGSISEDQMAALEALATDLAIEQQVAELLREQNALPVNYELGMLTGQIKVAINGNNMQIIVTTNTQTDAERLAALWTKQVVMLVTELYIKDQPAIAITEQQLAEARARYQQAQANLESFLASDALIVGNQEVRRLNDLIESARSVPFARLNEYLARQNEIELILRDARLLRDRLTTEQGNNIADATAALLLRIRNLSTRGNQPILQLDSSVVTSAEVSVEDLNRLITSLEREYQSVSNRIDQLRAETDVSTLQDLITQLTAVQVRVEQLNARQRDLVNERDQAYAQLVSLQQRLKDLKAIAPSSSLRPISDNPIAYRISRLRPTILSTAIGGLAGIVLTAAVIIAREALITARRGTVLQPKPTGD
ncbi:GumC domain-containing protein [Chloroflexus aggregans]|uniref:Lipopolysaccharide biosynthesis protein n=1 Tax=Chloroflexus aggregans (strain MD-66 / DSM 9485) TaxID=326427 RepID=B8GBQ2_CHLAD|nr:LPS biosynthesis protein [Chloroflexus aggregans]ACL24869.1 lipopolysaccharide biosynthesis protein [Chloroflexus aggregans DSM 9485]